MFGRRRTPSARPSLLIFRIERPIARISHLLCCTGSLAVVLSFWRRDRNLMDSWEDDDTSWYRTPSFFMIMQGVTPPLSWTSCTAGNSETFTVLNRYESKRLVSLRQSERTTVRDLVQQKKWIYPCYRAVNMELSTKMAALMVYDALQTFGKRW